MTMSFDEWLKEYDRLFKQRDELYERQREYEHEYLSSSLSIGERQTHNAYAMRDLADEAATMIREFLEAEGLRPDGTRE